MFRFLTAILTLSVLSTSCSESKEDAAKRMLKEMDEALAKIDLPCQIKVQLVSASLNINETLLSCNEGRHLFENRKALSLFCKADFLFFDLDNDNDIKSISLSGEKNYELLPAGWEFEKQKHESCEPFKVVLKADNSLRALFKKKEKNALALGSGFEERTGKFKSQSKYPVPQPCAVLIVGVEYKEPAK